ncbi:YdcF family protein [Cupriavidus sp. CP313]
MKYSKMMPTENRSPVHAENEFSSRIELMDYISPETEICRSQFALMFGSRHAQLEMIDAALGLFRAGYYETLVIAGGMTRGSKISEASEIADKLVSSGLSWASIVLEEESSNTGENIRNTRHMMNHFGLRELLLIGKIYAKRRYVMTIKKQWPEIERVSCATVNYFGVDRLQWWKSLTLRSRILGERRKIKEYLQRGYLSEVEVIDRQFRL